MKILTDRTMNAVATRIAAAAELLADAEALARNAHRSSHLVFEIRWARRGAEWAGKILADGRANGYLAPPRTRKAERMERKEKDMRRVTMGGSGEGQGPGYRLSSGTVPDARQTAPKEVKE